jgi:hypothetical protein
VAQACIARSTKNTSNFTTKVTMVYVSCGVIFTNCTEAILLFEHRAKCFNS